MLRGHVRPNSICLGAVRTAEQQLEVVFAMQPADQWALQWDDVVDFDWFTDTLRFEKRLVDDWLRKEFKDSRSAASAG